MADRDHKREEELGRDDADKSVSPWLLGIGLDGDDGHLRITRGQTGEGGEYRVVGGCAKTHEEMQASLERLTTELRRRGKALGSIPLAELREIAREAGL
ncbi:MAG: hypothetical protein AB1486_31325 [Planctomycetota bacterium]